MLGELLEKLGGRIRQRQGSALDQLQAAAVAHAKGETVDVGAVEAALYDARMEVDDFAKLCEREVQRQGYAKEFEQLAAARTRVARLEAEGEKLNNVFAEQRQAFESSYLALREKERDARRSLDKAEAARDWLINPANVLGGIAITYREALERLQAANVEHGRLVRAVSETRSEISSEAGWIEQLTKEGDGVLQGSLGGSRQATGLTAERQQKLDQHQRRSARLTRQLNELEGQVKAAAAELAEATRAVELLQARILKQR